MFNFLTIFFTLILLSIVQSYPNNELNHTTKCQESPNIPENIITFVTLVRRIQRDIDQTKQSFNDVVKQNQYWLVKNSNGEEIKSVNCINIIKLERTKFANYVLGHENDFENCADQLIVQYKISEYQNDLHVIENEALKCISIVRLNKFWSEYGISKRHFTEICTTEGVLM